MGIILVASESSPVLLTEMGVIIAAV